VINDSESVLKENYYYFFLEIKKALLDPDEAVHNSIDGIAQGYED
jgi:hypothetical protein